MEGNLEAALSEQARRGAERKLTGKEEALLVAAACSAPPPGRKRWTLELLADEVVRLSEHDKISRETMRRRLHENDLKPWRRHMCCIAKVDAEYVARMEDVLDLYSEEPDPQRPVVCFDESPEHLHEVNRCRGLFATHFHELTVLSEKLSRLANATMRVKEWEGDVIFLHEVGPGAADRSYGIQVARLSGLPASVLARARAVLDQLEDGERQNPARQLIDGLPLFSAGTGSDTSRRTGPSEIEETLAGLDPDDMTAREALEVLYALRAKLDRAKQKRGRVEG